MNFRHAGTFTFVDPFLCMEGVARVKNITRTSRTYQVGAGLLGLGAAKLVDDQLHLLGEVVLIDVLLGGAHIINILCSFYL